ncbi:MAG: hypothetical protein Q8Q94_00530 [bacterium]|nr:hypothetical protein [bacterium]MDZ4299846.1 hypothetical protein [Candidatus Sungbacteria bacterium]
MILQDWGYAILTSLSEVAQQTLGFVPQIIGALIVFVAGWIIAVSVGKVVEHILRALHTDSFLEKLDAGGAFEKAGVKLRASSFIGGLVRWFLIIAFLLAAANILQLQAVAEFLKDVLNFVPNIVVAALILVIAAVVIDVIERPMHGMVAALGARGAIVGAMVRWAVWIFAILAVLVQLRIAADLVHIIVQGMVAALAIALGLAFGLGGKETAAAILDKVRREMEK